MKLLKWLLIVIVVVVLLAAGYLAYLGFFSAMKVTESKMGPYTIAYESFTGPYAQTGPVFANVYTVLKTIGITTTLGLGIYYDDPSKVAAEKLRSDCGVVIDAEGLAKLKELQSKFKIKKLSQSDCLVTEFPIRNTLSYMIGPMKAYPALMKAATAKGYQGAMTYELYDEGQGKITFVLVIAK